MKVFRSKILLMLTLPVLLFSISGAGLHLHYCNSKSELITHIHLDGENSSLSSCCDELLCCGDHIPDLNQPGNDIRCCTDVYTEAETDKDYQIQIHQADFFTVITELPYIRQADTDKGKLTISPYVNNFTPPELLSTVVLLI
jgi:hypothetical protein